jgi:hypothetical protein
VTTPTHTLIQYICSFYLSIHLSIHPDTYPSIPSIHTECTYNNNITLLSSPQTHPAPYLPPSLQHARIPSQLAKFLKLTAGTSRPRAGTRLCLRSTRFLPSLSLSSSPRKTPHTPTTHARRTAIRKATNTHYRTPVTVPHPSASSRLIELTIPIMYPTQKKKKCRSQPPSR